jgi:predicted glycosyltransferase involved in capsule biosynthesis
MQKQQVALNKKTKGRNGCQKFSYSKLFQNDFVICDVCCSLSEESALEKLQRLTKEVETQKNIE